MRIHALEATGGLTYAQMGRFMAKPGTPAKFTDGHGGTSDEQYALVDPKTKQPVDNGARNLWVTETALTTALNTSYMAEQIALFGIVVGIALLLAGIGFGILAIGGALGGKAGVRPRAQGRAQGRSPPPGRNSSSRRTRQGPPPGGPSPLGLVLEQAVVERVADELGAAREAELLHDVRAVRLGRAHRDVELLRDLLVRVAEREQPQHLALALGERVLLGAPRSADSAATSRAPSSGWT